MVYLVFLRIFQRLLAQPKFLYFEKRHKFQPLISRSKTNHLFGLSKDIDKSIYWCILVSVFWMQKQNY